MGGECKACLLDVGRSQRVMTNGMLLTSHPCQTPRPKHEVHSTLAAQEGTWK